MRPLAGAVVVALCMHASIDSSLRGDVIAPTSWRPSLPAARAAQHANNKLRDTSCLAHTAFFLAELAVLVSHERRLSLNCAMTPKSDRMHPQPSLS